MSETINRRIIEKIEKMDCSKEVKLFLNEILLIELRIFEERLTRYTDEYYRAIKKHIVNYKEG